MKLSLYACASLVAGALLLASSFPLAQTTWMAGSKRPHNAVAGQSSGSQPQPASQQSSGNSQAAQRGSSGVNPLYESKDKANRKPNSGASTVEYKDSGDMTTRYRPGNNKTTRNSIAVDHAGGNGFQDIDGEASVGAHAEAARKKHRAGVKYEDRASGGRNQMQMQHTSGRGSGH